MKSALFLKGVWILELKELKDIDFSHVMQEYELMIYKIIKLFHVREEDVEELYQEGLVGLWYAWKGYEDSKASFSTYAYCTIRGMLLNLIKKDRRFHDTHCTWNPEMEELIPDLSLMSIKEQLREIESYTINLSEKQKIWLIEYIVNGKSLDEIASEYGTTVSAVKSWRRSALKNIRENLIE